MFLRALAAFLLLPGIFAGLIPALIVGGDSHRVEKMPMGYVPLIIGLGLLLCASAIFGP
jgi:hypothetical protein